ncbi:hypothetical protein HO133_003510 [Letharia lupina]|uniref:Glycoside hydrolase subgroup catalytic core protein n=1 Tax=Letharia lupina TaxID=560253 RepID=A0A8H6CBA5_9LECA|nr:uncharacterized protein HO133_003510 [Letharia lupina]KAF6220378.1 hypothetical protein HO133_003510 [Letharia lupina]
MRLGVQLPLAFLSLHLGRFTLAVDTWCGKAYRSSDPAVDPGGRIVAPPRSPAPLLNLKIRPRAQPYLEEDIVGTFIVDAPLSYFYGQPYDNTLFGQQNDRALKLLSNVSEYNTISFYVNRSDDAIRPISYATVKLNSTGTLFDFDLSEFEPRFEPYNLSVVAMDPNNHIYMASTQLLRLPSRSDGGSVTKIDSLHGGLLVKATTISNSSSGAWTPLFPYSFYLDGNWLGEDPKNMNVLKNYGYNVLHIVPAGGLGYDFEQLDEWLDQAQQLGLWIMFDMRWQYQNASGVDWQVNQLKRRPNMLLWYTADEPDGQVDALNAPKRAYDQIKSLDPYHPVSLCLNCENYHYQEYSTGADIILSDVYPIGTNTSWSTQYGTVCNSTYGCCGCDNCQGYNNLSNVPARLDIYREYQMQLGLPPKVLWGTPQAFGNSEFWKQTPTPEEELAMTLLSVNHGAKGIIMWTFPTTPDLTDVTSRLAKVLTGTCAEYLLGADIITGLAVDGTSAVDASAWRVGNSILLSIVNSDYQDMTGPVTLHLPAEIVATSISTVLWGDAEWRVTNVDSKTQIQRSGLQGLSSDILILSLELPLFVEEQDSTAVA